MPPFHTRVATLADLDAIAPLFDAYRQFYGQVPDLDLANRFLHARLVRGESVVLVATDANGRAVGFSQLYPSFCSVEAQPIGVLYDLFVAPEARRFGVGTLLLQAAEQHALRSGQARMDLTTAKTNQRAQSVYEALGWVKDEVFWAYNKRVQG